MKMILVFILFTIEFGFAQISGLPFDKQTEFGRVKLNYSKSLLQKESFPEFSLNESKEVDGKKKVGLAVLYSLLLPGMGELYVGDYNTGKYLTIAEGALWITYGAFYWNGSWIQNDARRFAVQHASANIAGKGDQYFVDIGNYNSVYEYNEEILRQRNEHKVYDPQSSFYWKWDSGLNREQYRDLRVSSDNVFNNARFVLAAVAVNHLISAFNAARLTISHNNEVEETALLNIHANVIGGISNPNGIIITVSKNF
jgi:hypothetical protein